MQLLYHHRQKLCSAGLVEYRVTKLEKICKYYLLDTLIGHYYRSHNPLLSVLAAILQVDLG